MTFARLVERTWNENRLFSAMLELTYRCNLDCWFCYNDLSLQGRPMERDDWLRVVDELAALGTLNLVLTGGEPLANPWFWDIGARARELGFATRVKSTGTHWPVGSRNA